MKGMNNEPKQRVVTLRKLRMDDPEVQFDQPVPGTPAERLGMVWELMVEALSIGGKWNAEQRLQRHVTHLVRGGG